MSRKAENRMLDRHRLGDIYVTHVAYAVHAFARSECDEAAVRIALDDAAPLYRDAPEAKVARRRPRANRKH
jgi:hypothetical protein